MVATTIGNTSLNAAITAGKPSWLHQGMDQEKPELDPYCTCMSMHSSSRDRVSTPPCLDRANPHEQGQALCWSFHNEHQTGGSCDSMLRCDSAITCASLLAGKRRHDSYTLCSGPIEQVYMQTPWLNCVPRLCSCDRPICSRSTRCQYCLLC